MMAIAAAVLCSASAWARQLTPAEVGALCSGGLDSMNRATAGHFDAIRATGISTLYGENSRYGRMSAAERQQWLKANKKPGTSPAAPSATSCVGWVMKHLGSAYAAAGLGSRFAEIKTVVRAHNMDGSYLMQELQKDGWTMVYWNPDGKKPLDGNEEHPYSYAMAKNRHYYQVYNSATDIVTIPVSEMLVNYRPAPGSTTTKDTSGLDKLGRVPLWCGIANGGYHCFLGKGGTVNESHLSRMPNDATNVEEGPFTRFGSTTSVKYLSGVLAIPPGTWR